MNYLSFDLKGVSLLLSVLFYVSFSFGRSFLLSPPLTVTEEGSAPEINFAFSYGTENDPVSATSSLTMVYAYTGYSIDEAESDITVDLAGSWFGNSSQVSVSHSIDHESREISVTLTRNDNQQIGGFGFTIRLKGIIVVVDDIGKISNPNEDFLVNAYFSTDTETLSLTMGEDYGPLQLALYTLNGSLVAQKGIAPGKYGKWNLGNIAPQIYVLEVASETQVLRKKIAIGQ